MGSVASPPTLPMPDVSHLPCTYWFWHRIPTSIEIRSQLAQMRQAGIMSFQVQARLSLPMEDYLSADYLAAYRQAVDEAARHGMGVGIYDDYNWQSGHAAGRVVDGRPELAETHLFWTSARTEPGASAVRLEVSGITSSSEDLGKAGMRWHYHGSMPRWADWTVLVGVVSPATRHPESPDAVLDVTDGCRVIGGEDGCVIEVHLPVDATGTVTVFVSARCATSRLMNHMDPEAVRRFIEVGYQPIADALGEHMGTTVRYLFFDQPHPNFFSWAQHDGQLGHAMPVSTQFVEHLRDRWGSRLGHVLTQLLHGDSSEAGSIRCDFYDDYGSWARETFLGQVRAWTSKHGIALSGHEVLPHVGGWSLDSAFRNWDLRVNFGLDLFAIDAYRDLTACDAQDAVPQLSPKLADAVARANGRRGAMLEQYYADAVAGTGYYTGHWGLTPGELRNQTVRHHLAGMRQQILHGFYLTDGHAGDTEMFANPRFDFPPGFNFEPWFAIYHSDIARESARLSRFLDDLEQDRRVALLYPTRTIWTDSQHGPHAAEFGRWAQTLTEGNVPFDIIDEAMLGTPAEPTAYDAVVLAGITSLKDRGTLDTLAAALRNGTELLVSGASPTVYQHGAQTAAEDWADLEARAGARITRHQHPPTTADELTRFRPRWLVAPTLPLTVALVRGTGPDGRQRLAAFNEGPAPTEVELEVQEGAAALAWDPISGEVRSLVRAAAGHARLHLAPSELILVEEIGCPEDAQIDGRAPQDDQPGSVQELLDGWTLRVSDGHGSAIDEDLVLPNVDVQQGLESQGLAAFSGVAVYARTVNLDRRSALLLELPHVVGGAEVFMNGRTIGHRGWAPYTFRIPVEATVLGRNHLQIQVAGTAANRYYADTGMRQQPEPCGIIGVPILRDLRPRR